MTKRVYEKEKEKVEDTPKIEVKKEPEERPEVVSLPLRPTLRVSEVAYYYGVTERTVYLWIQHGHLLTEKTPMGQWRVTRESLDKCRFAKRRIHSE
jgi:excisionase family DNA binding protein